MQLNPCIECGSEPEYYRVADTVFWGCSNEACNSTPAISVDRGVVHHEIINGHYWQEANPISAAGKMLIEQGIVISEGPPFFHYGCKFCGEYAKMTPASSAIKEMMSLEHSHACPLITEAKLPLKVKDNDTP